jgi:hypothetical protein
LTGWTGSNVSTAIANKTFMFPPIKLGATTKLKVRNGAADLPAA